MAPRSSVPTPCSCRRDRPGPYCCIGDPVRCNRQVRHRAEATAQEPSTCAATCACQCETDRSLRVRRQSCTRCAYVNLSSDRPSPTPRASLLARPGRAVARWPSVVIEGPGQGGVLYERRLPLRPDYESVLTDRGDDDQPGRDQRLPMANGRARSPLSSAICRSCRDSTSLDGPSRSPARRWPWPVKATSPVPASCRRSQPR